MKRIFIYMIAVVCLVATATSCLDKHPLGAYTEDDKVTASVEGKVFGIYGKIRGYDLTAGIPAFAVHNFRSEDSEKGSDAGDGPNMERFFDNFEYNASSGEVKGYWNNNYAIIFHCNTIIDLIEKNPSPLDIEKINLGEVKFFRAYCFFNLVRAFGDVPKIDFRIIENDSEANIPKSSVNDIYDLIDKDLKEATLLLPKSWESDFIGRLTWGAARSLHARTYMMRNDWSNMHAAATEVINSGIYNLSTPYDQIFTDAGENCPESIFELQCTATAARPASTEIGGQFAEVQGIRGPADLGWGWHMATTELGNAYETGDPRKDATLLYFSPMGTKVEDLIVNKPYGETFESSAMGGYFNKKAYTDPAKRKLYSNKGHWVNIRLIRYADIVLMASESANELGDATKASNFLEQVRARARQNNATILPKVTTTVQADLRKAIQHERRIELALEADRFYDLVRWGTATEVLHAAGKTGYTNKHRYFPIPQDEIDKSNGILKQNPDWGG